LAAGRLEVLGEVFCARLESVMRRSTDSAERPSLRIAFAEGLPC